MNIPSGIPPMQPSLPGGVAAMEQIRDNASLSEDAKTREAARQFEAVLVRQILDMARKTGIESSFNEDSASKDIYFDMMNFHLAESISSAGALGLGDMIYQQLQGETAAPDTPDSSNKES